MIRNATLAVLLAATATTTAHAQPTPPEDPRQAQARAYFDRGVAHFKAGRYLEARAEFAAGYELSRRPLFLFNMAECSRVDGNFDLAREGYERYLREAPNGSEAALAKQRLAALAEKAKEPPPPPPSTPTPPPIEPRPVAPPPAPVPAAPPVSPPVAIQPIPAAAPATTTTLTACAGGACDQGRWSQKQIVGLGAGGAGVAFVAIGVWYWRRSVSRGDQVTAECASGCDWNTAKGTYDESQKARTGELVFLGLGTVAAVAGGYLYYLGTQEHKHSRFSVAPRPDGAALTWSGSW